MADLTRANLNCGIIGGGINEKLWIYRTTNSVTSAAAGSAQENLYSELNTTDVPGMGAGDFVLVKDSGMIDLINITAIDSSSCTAISIVRTTKSSAL